MFNEIIMVAVTPFSGTTTPDKNNRMPVMLQLQAGTMPNRNVLSGTVAERQGFEIGHTYLAQCREVGTDADFGQVFTFIRLSEIVGVDIIKAKKELGEAKLINVNGTRPEEFYENYERKGDAVEGIFTKRAKEGKFAPVAQSRATIDHPTTASVHLGTSTESDEDVTGRKL